MQVVQQITRNSLAWLLAAMFAGIAPHALRLPWWIVLLCLFCGGWRILVYRGRVGLPGRPIRWLIVIAGISAVVAHYGTLIGPEAGTALLIVGYAFKLLEMRERRDAFVVVILAFFVVATLFLFEQSLLTAAYMLLVIIMITAALAGLCQSPLQQQPRRTLRVSLILLGQSVPLMLLLFLFVPRVAPLWSLDIGGGSGAVGVSEEITPGDIAELSRSPALAFRVEFEGEVPPTSALYWRGMVMSHFDGRTWRRAEDRSRPTAWLRQPPPDWLPEAQPLGRQVSYRVIQEPSWQPWLFTLPLATSSERDIGFTGDYHLQREMPLKQRYAYRVTSFLDYRLSAQLDESGRALNLQLPAQGNDQSRALAAQWRARFEDDWDLVTEALRMFRDQPYHYTLKPPLLRGDTIDQFLFETRRGFCSHYAGAFVFLMRAAGIPARMVAGYQGGEYNQLGNYVLVHQFDAHAWAEVWLPGQGWLRVDPTQAVAPERVEQGIEEALAGEESFLEDRLFSPARYRALSWVNQLRMSWDYLQHAWNRFVLGYNHQSQMQLLKRWFGDLNLMQWALLLGVGVFLVLIVQGWWLFQRRARPKEPEALRLYRRFCERLAACGIAREVGEAPMRFAERVANLRPDLAVAVKEITLLYQKIVYAPANAGVQKQGDRHTRSGAREPLEVRKPSEASPELVQLKKRVSDFQPKRRR